MNSEAATALNHTDQPFDWSLARRVLLVRLRSIGDTVLMTPCIDALKKWRPELQIGVVSEPLAAPLLEDQPLVDELIVAERSLRARASLVARLRNSKFDVAFNLHGGSTGAILCRLASPRYSVGYRGLGLSWLLRYRAPSPDAILRRSQIHSVEQQLALLHWSGVPWPESRPQPALTVAPRVKEAVRSRLETLIQNSGNLMCGFACVVPGAALESKRWTEQGFAAVADHLSERWSLPCAIIAGPGQENLARDVAAATHAPCSVISGLSLRELVALLEMTQVFVGNDSGPMHIAAALRTPIVAVWGSSNPTVWHPWSDAPWRIVPAKALDDASKPKSSPKAHIKDIKQVAVNAVIDAVDEVLKLALGAHPKAGILDQPKQAKMDFR